MKRISVNLKCAADQYAMKPDERIIEFTDTELQIGGLISFKRREDGKLQVELYSLDDGVIVLSRASGGGQ